MSDVGAVPGAELSKGETVDVAARIFWEQSRALTPGDGQHIAGVFNGTPMRAFASDECAQVVLTRWHYVRLILGYTRSGRSFRELFESVEP